MPATRIETKTLEKIATIAGGLAGLTGRVLTGLNPLTDSTDFYQTVCALTKETQGYFWVSLQSIRCVKREIQHDISFHGELYVPVARETATSLVTAWEFALSLRDALEATANWGAGTGCPPQVSVELVSVDDLKGTGLVAVFGFGGRGGSMVSVDP